MPKYICPRCGYICTQRNDMRKHFKRKKICSPVLEDISREKCFSLVLGETYENKISVNSKNVKIDKKTGNYANQKCNSKMQPAKSEIIPQKLFIFQKTAYKLANFVVEFYKTPELLPHKKDRCKVKDELTKQRTKINDRFS